MATHDGSVNPDVPDRQQTVRVSAMGKSGAGRFGKTEGRRADELDGRSKVCDDGRDTDIAGETESSRTRIVR